MRNRFGLRLGFALFLGLFGGSTRIVRHAHHAVRFQDRGAALWAGGRGVWTIFREPSPGPPTSRTNTHWLQLDLSKQFE